MFEWVVTLSLLSALAWTAVVDLRSAEIPNGASLLVATFGMGVWIDQPGVVAVNFIVAGIAVTVLGLGGGFAWKRTGREWLGLGDAKLIGAGTMVVGWNALWLMLFLAAVGAICSALILRHRTGDEGIPFGPFLAYAIFVTHLIAGPSS